MDRRDSYNYEKQDRLKELEGEEVELLENKYVKNIASPFINQKKTWDNIDDHDSYSIPDDIKKNIEDNLGFLRPSNIQAFSIPMIMSEPYHNLIAQARNGCGKTGCFAIGSTLRIDRDNHRPQVLVIVNTRELCNQIHSVYDRIIRGTGITLSNFMFNTAPSQIIVTTHGKIEPLVGGRKPLDLSQIKCFVIDEADCFLLDDKNFASLKTVANCKDIKNRSENNKVQWILFSATYPEGQERSYEMVQARMSELVEKAQQITIKAEKLKLEHVKQFVMRCEPKRKLEFIKEVFECCEMTQTFIFVNSLNFAEKIHLELRKAGFSSFIMFSKMSREERDDTLQKFREQKINVLITTNLIARGIDVPEVELVINYDVPLKKVDEDIVGDAECYLHRIGRTGRFGKTGIALTIWDREQDKHNLDQIIKYYGMDKTISDLNGPSHLKDLLRQISADEL